MTTSPSRRKTLGRAAVLATALMAGAAGTTSTAGAADTPIATSTTVLVSPAQADASPTCDTGGAYSCFWRDPGFQRGGYKVPPMHPGRCWDAYAHGPTIGSYMNGTHLSQRVWSNRNCTGNWVSFGPGASHSNIAAIIGRHGHSVGHHP